MAKIWILVHRAVYAIAILHIYVCIWIYFPSWLVIFPSHQLQKTRGSVEAASVSYIKMHESKTAPPWSPSPYHHKQVMSRYRWPKPEQFRMCRHHQHNSDIRQISRSYTRALSPLHSRVRRKRHHAVRFSCIIQVKQITQKVFCSFLFCPYSSPPSSRFYHPEVSQVQSVSFFSLGAPFCLMKNEEYPNRSTMFHWKNL